MKSWKAYITGMGVVCSAGKGREAFKSALQAGRPCFQPLDLFPTAVEGPPLAGQAPEDWEIESTALDLPRSHQLVMTAVREALVHESEAPGAVVVASSTGGIPLTEERLEAGDDRPDAYRYHGLTTVAEQTARFCGCTGPVLTVSTACSSGGAAVKIGLELIRAGQVRSVLVCGVDALSRLTFHGFHFLQLIDPTGARPLDKNRLGLTLGEGAAALLIRGADTPPEGALAEILGAGLSCDAYHPAAPHPQGAGAVAAMTRALEDAGCEPGEVDYINLHGTGTRENDASEAYAVREVFGPCPPSLSSSKGVFGHTLAAAGVIEAVAAVLALTDGFLPLNAGLVELDPDLEIDPLRGTLAARPARVLSNSFGFGGNNAAVVFGRPDLPGKAMERLPQPEFTVIGSACLTGQGFTEETMNGIVAGMDCRGRYPTKDLGAGLPPRRLRRLKRLTKIVLGLTHQAGKDVPENLQPKAVYFGTGWGSLSETHDFLKELFDSQGQSASPIDFIGSVHNAPAGQAAMLLGADGPNITASGGDYSFEQALYLAGLFTRTTDAPFLLAGADEFHETLSPLFDPRGGPADGGGALVLSPDSNLTGPRLKPCFFENQVLRERDLAALIQSVGGPDGINDRIGAIWVNLPAADRDEGEKQLKAFLSLSGYVGPVVDFRPLWGEFATASAVAAVVAVRLVEKQIPFPGPAGRPVLLLTLGACGAATLVSKGS